MTTDELLPYISAFQEIASALRRLGDAYPSVRVTKVLVSANMAADYAERAAHLVEEQIEAAEIAAVAQEECPCSG